MQSIEAIISSLVFLSIATFVLSADPGPPPSDDGLYRMQLAGDAWRVLYLRGDIQDLSADRRAAVEADMALIGEQTGLCLFMDGIEFTNCRGGEPHENIISIRRTVIYRKSPLAESEPVAVTFTISR